MSEEPRRKISYLPDTHRLLPQSADAERGVLSSMMLGGPELVEGMAGMLTPAHFFIPANELIFRGLLELQRVGKPTDFITLTALLRDQNELDQCGGGANVTEIFTFLPTAANAAYYADILREKFALREMIKVATEFAARGYDEQDQPWALVEAFQTAAVELGGNTKEAEAMRMVSKAEIFGRLDNIEARYHNRGKIGGLSTGFVDLDRTLDGLKGKHVYVFAGRPGMGKSAIGVNIAEHICVTTVEETNAPVVFFTLEMPREQVIDRILFARAEINLGRIRDGFMSEADFPKLTKAAHDMMKGKLILDDTPGLTIAQFRARARRAVVKEKAKLIVIDYVQIMKGSSKRGSENRVLELTEIMQGIRETAKQLDVPIIVLAQLNRAAEDRPQSRPALADLKECGAIEEEANVVGLLYRPAYYAKTDAKREEIATKYGVTVEEVDTIAEIEIAKQRNGGVGTIQLRFLGEFTRFQSVTKKLFSNNADERQGVR